MFLINSVPGRGASDSGSLKRFVFCLNRKFSIHKLGSAVWSCLSVVLSVQSVISCDWDGLQQEAEQWQ